MENTRKNKNPLTAYMRRPKLFLRLPSKGNFWFEDALDFKEENEYEVYPMTVKDELLLKTPDALLNGYSTVEVIQSCIPAIKDAWAMPSVDLDAILIAIRIASYGEKMNMDVTIPGTEESEPFEIDVRPMLDSMVDNFKWDPSIQVNENIKVFIKPINYKEMTQANLMTFEGERLLRMMNDDEVAEETKVELLNQAAGKIADANLVQILNGILRIETPEGTTDDREHIRDFLANSDPEVYKAVSKRFKELNDKNNLSNITLQTPPEYVAKGSPETITIPFEFDYARFFV